MRFEPPAVYPYSNVFCLIRVQRDCLSVVPLHGQGTTLRDAFYRGVLAGADALALIGLGELDAFAYTQLAGLMVVDRASGSHVFHLMGPIGDGFTVAGSTVRTIFMALVLRTVAVLFAAMPCSLGDPVL